jgi:hypothetical protein
MVLSGGFNKTGGFNRTSFLKKTFIFGLFFLVLAVLLVELGILGFKLGFLVSPSLQKKAQAVGYKLVYQGDPFDRVGRTVLVSETRKDAGGFYDFWGDEEVWWKTGKLYGIYGVGFFQGWEEIENSEDRYMIVSGPKNQGRLKLRVSLVSWEEWFENEDLEYGPTKLAVDNLNILNDVDTVAYSTEGFHVSLGYVADFGLDQLEKILKKGDVVAFSGRFQFSNGDIPLMENGQPVILTDESGVPILSNLILRRFGGIEQLGEELGVKIAL